jgi:uncharacterized alkaline shock family protein YloU
MKEEKRGEGVEVSRETIAELAVQAVSDIEGVKLCQQKASTILGSRVKREFVHKGVKVNRDEDFCRLGLCLKVDYGTDIPELARRVRSKVEEHVRGLTDIVIDDVEIVIDDIEPPA